jgi:hypothetical protein
MSSTPVPIVFVHIGDAPPDYAAIAVRQARRWNPNTPIVFLSSVLGDFGAGEEWILLEDIPKSANHNKFCATTVLDTKFRNGFWRSTTERLFFIEDWAAWKGVEEFFHIENDITLYMSLDEMLPTLRIESKGISAPFQGQGTLKKGDARMCFSVLYCNQLEALSGFLYFLAGSRTDQDEMIRGGLYWQDSLESCSSLPTVPPTSRFVSDTFRDWYISSKYSWVFDGAAHGQYLGGEDPRNGSKGPGFVNTDVDFRADQFLYGWKADAVGRRFPVLMDRCGKEWRIANLHIHCKRLADFQS